MKLKPLLLIFTCCAACFLAVGCSKQAKLARYLKRAEAHYKSGNYEVAEIEYLNVLRQSPTNLVANRVLGFMAYEQGRLGRAVVFLGQVQKASPDDDEVGVKLATIRLAGGSAKEAYAQASAILDRHPTNTDALLLLIDASTTNQLAAVSDRLRKLSPGLGNAPGFFLAQGSLQLRQQNLPQAEQYFRQAVAADPKSDLARGMVGHVCALRKDFTNADAEFKLAAELSPVRSSHRLRYADFKIGLGQLSEAKAMLNQLVRKAPDYLPAWLRIARVALAEKHYDDCDAALRNVTQREPADVEAILLLANLRLRQNAPDKAVEALEKGLKYYPRFAQFHYHLALARAAQGDLSSALNSLGDALGYQPEFPQAELYRAELLLRRGQAASAIASLNELLRKHPGLLPAHMLLASAQTALGQLDAALKTYSAIRRSAPTNMQPVFLSGLVLAEQGNVAEARKAYETASGLAPESLAPVEQLINLDLRENRFDLAIQRANERIDRAPTNAGPYMLLAQVYFAQTNLTQAEANLLKANELDPEFRPANALLARVYVASHKQQDALQKLEEMVARNTNDVVCWQQIGELHEAATNYVAARTAYEHAIAARPNFVPSLNNLAYLAAEHLGDLKLAYDLGSRAHELMVDDPATSDTFGWVLYHTGDYPRALGLIQQSARLLPEQPEVLFHLGMVHYMMGEAEPARVALQGALQLARDGNWRQEASKRLHILKTDPTNADATAAGELASLGSEFKGDPILQLRLAALAEQRSAWLQAATCYEKALQINSNLVSALVPLAKLNATHLTNHARAFQLARRARLLEPNDPVIAHTLGQLAFTSAESGADFQWTYGLLQQSATASPDDSQVQFDFARAAYAVGRVNAAIGGMQKVLATKPDSHLAAAARSFLELNALLSNPATNTAVALVQEALRKSPDDVPALMLSARLQELQRDYRSARDTYLAILKRLPLFAPASRALALLCFGDLADPKSAYEHAVVAREAFPQDPDVARVLGLLCYERSDFSRAALLLEECARSFPADAELMYRLGFARFRLKESQASKAWLTKAVALAPASKHAPEARRILAQL